MKLNQIICFFFCFLLISPHVYGSDPGRRFQALQNDYSRLLRSEDRRLYRDNWEKLINAFDGFSRDHPEHEKGPAALFMAARASQGLHRFSRRIEDARRAGRFYDKLEESYPCHNLTDDALVMSAEIHEEILGDKEGAVERYIKVLKNHSSGDQIFLAKKRLESLGVSPPPVNRVVTSPPQAEKTKGGPIRIDGIRHFHHGDFSRVVLDVSGPVTFSSNALPPVAKGEYPRLYLDLKDIAPIPRTLTQKKIDDPLVRRIRIGSPQPDTTRVVLDLKELKDYRIYSLDSPARVVIEVARSKQSWEQSAGKIPDTPQKKEDKGSVVTTPPAGGGSPAGGKGDVLSPILEKSAGPPCPVIPIPALAAKNGPRRIVVDPGHGGKDPGAIGPNGLQEKDVVLTVAKRLAERLKKELKCEVVLTRDKDVFIPLRERTAIANRLNADLFISVHANASVKPGLRGLETYYLNFSKNEMAASVAARENGTSLAEVGELELILFDLMAHAKINESSLLADKVQKGMVSSLGRRYKQVRDNGVRQGPFHVLLGANMPSILVEIGFISNPQEESWLQAGKYQDGVVEGIIAGVKNFDYTLSRMAKR